MVRLVVAAMVALSQAGPPAWTDLSREARAAIFEHRRDIIKLPNGTLVDLWPLGERERAFGRALRQSRRGEREVADTRESRAWRLRLVDQLLDPQDSRIPRVTDHDDLSFEGYESDGVLLALYGVPRYQPNSAFRTEAPTQYFDPARATADTLRARRCSLPRWLNRAGIPIATDDAAFLTWVEGRAWSLTRVPDVRILMHEASHVEGDMFEWTGRRVEIPRGLRGPCFVWCENLYDPDRIDIVLEERDLSCTRDEIVEAIWNGQLVIQTWILTERNGVDIWERSTRVDAGTLVPLSPRLQPIDDPSPSADPLDNPTPP